MLSPDEKTRYARQIPLPQWGEQGQERLKQATVCLLGAGGLGSAAAYYLAAAGVGHLRICDHDRVDLSNLNRQILHATPDLGRRKVDSAQARLQQLNPNIDIQIVGEPMTAANVAEVVGASDMVVDCLDTMAARKMLNRYTVEHAIPFVYGGVQGLTGMLSVFRPPETPCFECLFPDAEAPPESLAVLGSVPGVIGSLQALEVVKYVVGFGELFTNRLLIFNGEDLTFRTIQLVSNPECAVCAGMH